jgi:hypothetical protein
MVRRAANMDTIRDKLRAAEDARNLPGAWLTAAECRKVLDALEEADRIRAAVAVVEVRRG